MLGLIGWFLGASARSVDRWVVLDGLIAGVRVGEAMEPTLETIAPQLTLDTFAGRRCWTGRSGRRCRSFAARSSSGSWGPPAPRCAAAGLADDPDRRT